MRILIAGCGYVGSALGRELIPGHDVFGLRRDPSGLPPGIAPVAADLTDPPSLSALPQALDVVVIAVSADARDPAAYRSAYVDGPRNLLERLVERGDPIARVLFTSSTAVYGQQSGEWVSEDSPTEPASETGRILVAAEATLRDAPWATVAVRFGGIYGPGRTRLLDRVRGGLATCPEGTSYTNRIHRDDCAGVLGHLIRVSDPEEVYCGVDHDPADRCEMLRWLADRLDVPPPPVEPAGRGRQGKRVRNDRLLASGYRFRYPSFREGYGALIG